MSFSSLPPEIIFHFSFDALAHSPLGPPSALLDLALTSRAFNAVVTSKPFLAKLCRLMFDVGPIQRRHFHPRDRDLADELSRCCRVLQGIRRAGDEEADDEEAEDNLFSAYILMLNNDGKNYAQLEHVGIDAYVDRFVRTCLWAGRETNQGWPLDEMRNASALWLMWMTLTKEKLLAESPAARAQMIHLTLPYVALPHRYQSALAPPNHFNLPLDPQNPYHQQPLVAPLSSSSFYPIYTQTHPSSYHYFNARIPLSQPLTTIAAKLLFVARKELSPIRPPPHLPHAPGPGVVGYTQEDYREVDRSPGARLCRLVRWDWDCGCSRLVGAINGQDDHLEEESRVWDTEWWRRLLCGGYQLPRPKYLPGDVFKLGSAGGSWHGKEYIPQGNLFVHFLRHPDIHYPGIPDGGRPNLFTEDSIGLRMKPISLDVREHHKICECPQESSESSNSHPYTAATPSFTRNPNASASSSSSTASSLPIIAQSGRCGVVPIPAPLVFATGRHPTNQQTPVHVQVNANDETEEDEDDQPQTSEALTLSLPSSGVNIIDYSMSNAWFPGHIGGVSFTKFPFVPTATGNNKPRRDKIICAVDFQVPDMRSLVNRPEESECLALGGRSQEQGQREKMNAYVYETYDPEKISTHRGLGMGPPTTSTSNTTTTPLGPYQCQRCVQREELIRLERKKAEERSKKMLDRELRSYGSVGGWDEDEDMDEDMDEDQDDEEMQDMDITPLNIDFSGIDDAIASFPSSSSFHPSSASSPVTSYGDDRPYGEPGYYPEDTSNSIIEPTRSMYDKCRIGVECQGVGDILLSGETGPKPFAVWQQYTMYGRIRPWDGLIGILRSIHTTNQTPMSNIFIFGYIVGEDNFVGEWRIAASDPVRPTWGGAIVMSRKVVGGGEQAGSQTQVQMQA